ncbi:MAG: PepSY-associated TM helix domain-containing protein [Marinoscillum sp.]
MGNRIYNVLFHTHTVSGLVISVALFVIFFAGSLSFFRDDIIAWERDKTVVHGKQMDINYDALLDTLEGRYGDLYGRGINIRQPHQERNVMISLDPSKDSLATDAQRTGIFTYLDTETFEEESYFSSYTLGEFLYRLHFFAQIPYPYGYFLSGFVAFFFLFAIITAVIIHWKKIVSNFYVFRPLAKLKTVWTDAHTALGLIGLPFQFVFAVTGAVLIIGTTVMLGPASHLIYGNNKNQMYRELMDQPEPTDFLQSKLTNQVSLNALIEKAETFWGNANLSRLVIENYGDKNMRVVLEGRPKTDQSFVGLGRVVFDERGNQLTAAKSDSLSYVVGADQTIRRLHFGDFGGYGLRVVYFTFGIISCFVILSGVLIWVEARNKKSNTAWKRKSNQWIGHIFLAIAMSMYPVTALAFNVVKLSGDYSIATPHVWIYQIYFISWLLLSVLFAIRRDNFFTTRYTLLIGSVLGFLVPLVNGLVSANWLWITYVNGKTQIFVVDFFWLITSAIALMIFLKMRNTIALSSRRS